MTIQENLLQRIHESEYCPICMDFIKIEEKVYTELCNHVYCISCLGEWCNSNATCPMDRLELKKVNVFNPIKADMKLLEITLAVGEYICRDKSNIYKYLTEEVMRILSVYIENYYHLLLLSNDLKKIYETFTEDSFQTLLDLNWNDSIKSVDVFLKLIRSVQYEYYSKLSCLRPTITKNDRIIAKRISQTKWCMRNNDDNIELVTYHKDLKFFELIYQCLGKLNEFFQYAEISFINIPIFSLQNNYRCRLRHLYENLKFQIPQSIDLILLTLNHARSLICKLPKPFEWLDLFVNTPESCLLCCNEEREDRVYGFDNCHHKICKSCEKIFDLRNIICPIENPMVRSKLISNPLDVEEILINACQELNTTFLKRSFKMIKFTRENYFKMITREFYGHSQLNVPTFISFFNNERLILKKDLETKQLYWLYYKSIEDHFTKEIKGKLDKHFAFALKCIHYYMKIQKTFLEFRDCEYSFNRRLNITEEMTEINIKSLFDQWNRLLQIIILDFDQGYLEDKNGHVRKVLQSLCELLALDLIK